MERDRDSAGTRVAPDERMLTRTSERAPTAVRAALILGALALAAFMVARVARFTVDDSYITLRYARSLARGAGLVYNLEGPRAEGYTSLLWTLCLLYTSPSPRD